MSEEQFKIWKQVEGKGLEKLGNIEKARNSFNIGIAERIGNVFHGKPP